MRKTLALVENSLLPLAVATAALGLLVPSLGIILEGGISPLLALLMLVISLTFDAHAVKLVFRKPSRQIWALGLVYGPMSLAGWLPGRLFFGTGDLAVGQTLVGTLPTDVSARLAARRDVRQGGGADESARRRPSAICRLVRYAQPGQRAGDQRSSRQPELALGIGTKAHARLLSRLRPAEVAWLEWGGRRYDGWQRFRAGGT